MTINTTDIRTTTKVSSDIHGNCSVVGCNYRTTDDISDSINHYLQRHSYVLLHVGQETTRDFEDNIHHSSVAVLGL